MGCARRLRCYGWIWVWTFMMVICLMPTCLSQGDVVIGRCYSSNGNNVIEVDRAILKLHRRRRMHLLALTTRAPCAVDLQGCFAVLEGALNHALGTTSGKCWSLDIGGSCRRRRWASDCMQVSRIRNISTRRWPLCQSLLSPSPRGGIFPPTDRAPVCFSAP